MSAVRDRAVTALAESVEHFDQDEPRMGVVHCKRDPYDVYIGRGRCHQSGELGQWGNPFSHRSSKYPVIRVATVEEAIERYRSWLWSEIAAERIDLEQLAALDGKTLGYWCAPNPCHGEVLALAATWAAARSA